MNDLFICHMPTGLAYCDRSREEHGDYKRIASLYWHDLTFVPAKGASGPLLNCAREHAATYQARRGETVQVSASGQTIVLGWNVPELKIGQSIWAKNNPEWGLFTVVAIEPEWYEIRGRAGVRVLNHGELHLWRVA